MTTLGRSGLRISSVALGCSGFGGRVAGADVDSLVGTAREVGINFFDTADVYQQGESERLLGAALRGHRDDCVVATKIRYGRPGAGADRKGIRIALERSLRRLGTEYVDVLHIHGPDPATPIEETIDTLQDLVRVGKVLYFGLCNLKAWQLVDAQHVARAAGGAPVTSAQCQMNIIDPRRLAELTAVAKKFEIGLLAASPLARGMLGGCYGPESPPPAGHPLLGAKGKGYWGKLGFETVSRVRQLSAERGLSTAQTALGALLGQPFVSAVLVGAVTDKHVRDISTVGPNTISRTEFQYLTVGGSPPWKTSGGHDDEHS